MQTPRFEIWSSSKRREIKIAKFDFGVLKDIITYDYFEPVIYFPVYLARFGLGDELQLASMCLGCFGRSAPGSRARPRRRRSTSPRAGVLRSARLRVVTNGRNRMAAARKRGVGQTWQGSFERLYRSQILQKNMRLKALAEIYTMHSFAPFWNPLHRSRGIRLGEAQFFV